MRSSEAIISAIQDMKRGQFRLTGIKVELEAQLDRGEADGCGWCDSGRTNCDDCDGSGEVVCQNCDDGEMRNPDYTAENDEARYITCNICDGSGELLCRQCDGSGTFDCDECGGPSENTWGREIDCHDFLLERLVPLGLAEAGPSDYSRKFRPKGALVFSKFYNDHSVDSEWTFTLSVESDPSVVLHLPKFLEIFQEFADEVGNGMDTRGAGMHIAVLNSEGAVYPDRDRNEDTRRFSNFKRSMSLLLPALYFLGSPDDVSRGLRYRQPRVESHRQVGGKYWAINYGGLALEFRVFETCYQNPEAILDNLVVIKNCLKFWSYNFKPSGLGKIAKVCKFGVDGDNSLKRFYTKQEHIDLLNGGLNVLKPHYYKISELKKQRKFDLTKRRVKSEWDKRKKDVESEYLEYENRFDLLLEIQHYKLIASQLSMHSQLPEDMTAIEKAVKAEITKQARTKLKPDGYIKRRLAELDERLSGQYVLTEEVA